MSEQNIPPIKTPTSTGGDAVVTEVAPDPRDATIAAQQAEIDRLTGELEQLGAREGRAEADDAFDEQARKEELQRQGLSEVDAAEQAAYEARLRADQNRRV